MVGCKQRMPIIINRHAQKLESAIQSVHSQVLAQAKFVKENSRIVTHIEGLPDMSVFAGMWNA